MRVLLRFVAVLSAATTLAMTPLAYAVCPFNADQQGSVNGTGTTDGLLFIRYALGLTSAALTANAAQGGATSTAVETYITNNKTALDIDGDGGFSLFDAQVVARHLFGFKGDALDRGLQPLEFAKRYGGIALQDYIDKGCTGLNDIPDPRVAVWNAMNTALTNGNAPLAKTYLTPNGLTNHGPPIDSLLVQMPAIVATYSPLTARMVYEDFAEYIVTRPIPGSPTGELQVFFVLFLRDPNGNWLIDAM